MVRHLGRLGHTVLAAASGAEVLDRLQVRGIAGLVLDLNLPADAPLELLPRLLERDPNLAVIVTSAQTDAQTASH